MAAFYPLGYRREMVEDAPFHRRWLLLTLIVILVWYPALTLLLGFWPGGKMDFSHAFPSMAQHILAGRFDVDPDAIGAEGFESGGRTVAYFGIFCALLRIPLVLAGHADLDITWWSCLTAAGLATWFQARAVLLIWSGELRTGRDWLAFGVLLSVLLGGQHIPFLRPSLFQEPVNWACAQAMAFIWLAMRGLTRPSGFDGRVLSGMALCAGLALLTRVSFGIGLYAALGLLLLVRVRPAGWAAPGMILSLFLLITGLINQDRWGNPLVFADFSRYGLSLDAAPERLGHLAAYGTFNPARIWLNTLYYFAPIWIWVRADGHVLFAEAQAAMMDAMELPAGSFPLTDGLILLLAAVGTARVRDRGRAALLVGLAVQPMLILCAISTAHRYRAEFMPFFFLAALFGLDAPLWARPVTARFRRVTAAASLFGIIASHAMAVSYAYSPLGPGEYYLERYGLIGMWRDQR